MGRKIKSAIMTTIFHGIWCGVTGWLFIYSPPNNAGFIYRQFSIDTSWLFILFTAGFIPMSWGVRLCKIFLPGLSGRALATIIQGTFAAWICYAELHWGIPLLSQIKGLESQTPYFSEISRQAGAIIPFFVGTTLLGLASLLEELPRWRNFQPLITATGIFGVGLGIADTVGILKEFWEPLGRIEGVIIIGVIVAAIAALTAYGKDIRNALVSEVSGWLSNSPLRVFLIVAFIEVYLVFVHPVIIKLTYVYLIEWSIVCFVAWRILRSIRFTVSEEYPTPVSSPWPPMVRHEQQVERLIDEGFAQASYLQQQFVEEGVQSELLSYLETLMETNGMEPGQISEVLHPLATYQVKRIPFLTFSWERRRIRENNKKTRREILEGILNFLRQRYHIQEILASGG